MSTQSYADALTKFAEELLSRATESRSQVAASAADRRDFESGRNMAYYEVLDIFSRIADEFEIDRTALGLPADALSAIVIGTISAQSEPPAGK